jgi:hypothetical protein
MSAIPPELNAEFAGNTSKTESQANALLELAEGDVGVFHTPDDAAFATFEVNGHRENYPVHSKRFKKQLLHRFYREIGGAPGPQALESALAVLDARALFEGEEKEVHLRVAEANGCVYIDLCNEAWEAVEISSTEWKIVSNPPVNFYRTRGMQALPRPTKGGSINDLRPFVNVADPVTGEGGEVFDDVWRLLLGWLIGALRPRGPFVMLAVQGGKDAAKSTVCKILRLLLDPSTAALRRLPRTEQDLAIAAKNAWILAFDNLSGVPDWTSDALCTVSTGGGLATRELFTNDDEALFNASRPMILNGIDDIATRPDLADRSLLLVLKPICDDQRRDEEELWRAFEAKRPFILGALYTAVSVVLRELPNVRLTKAPRMADFTKWVTAAESAFGWDPESFAQVYARNRAASVEVTYHADLVVPIIVELLGQSSVNGVVIGKFDGTATKLYEALQNLAPQPVLRSKAWPKSPSALGKHLRNRATAPLKHAGVVFTEGQEGKGAVRMIHLAFVDARVTPPKTPAIPVSPVSGAFIPNLTLRSEGQRMADGRAPAMPSASRQPTPIASTGPAAGRSADGSNGGAVSTVEACRQPGAVVQEGVTKGDSRKADGSDSTDGSLRGSVGGANDDVIEVVV